ncbi:cytosolic carboxypeptidase 3-like [Colossoma macropomum]|uniref:cytosolic carboxypeptidase 3-like n=1 Tax=Colossoma macropomum TaxID=42526 RepID=UPI00186499F1|nr:cytosolic carboxypeptidase 3-like [Colossoma macropomum]
MRRNSQPSLSSFLCHSASDKGEEVKEKDQQLRKKAAVSEQVSAHSPEVFLGVPTLPRTTQVVFEHHSGRVLPQLCEPRDLFGVRGNNAQVLPRWPQECEVIPEEIHHIDWAPASPEPLSLPVKTSKCSGNSEGQEGTLVYDTQQGLHYFSGSQVKGRLCSPSQASVSLTGPDDTTLLFEGRFESGNLLKAHKVGEFDYELTLRTDLYTVKDTQWFYFQVKNMRAGVRYRFTITNFLKSSSLYEQGQKPLLYSEQKARSLGVGWHRVGQDVSYFCNGRVHLGKPCYSLSWTLLFPFDQDVCYFAHCYPYTYTKLWSHLSDIECNPRCSRFCKVRILCRSLAGNLVPVVTITNPNRDKEAPAKPAVVLSARIHPGETNSSWVMKGILDFLLGESPNAALLRDMFVFKLLPMLNPDGVIVGNYRCSLSGRDLNRNYRSVLRDSFPSVWATQQLAKRLCEERKVLLYCDLHGHSRKNNVFIYGCEGPRQGLKLPLERVFPLMFHKNCPDMFSFQSCTFKVQRRKRGTGRVALWRLGILNSFTLETSFCGSTVGQRKGTHFNIRDLEMLGTHFCDTLLDYCDPVRTKYNACLRELQGMLRGDIPVPADSALNDHDTKNKIMDTSRTIESPSGSNSSDSDRPRDHPQYFAERKLLKSRKERNNSSLCRDREKRSSDMLMKKPPVVSESEHHKTKQKKKGVSSGNEAPVSVLYLVFDRERSALTSKSEYVQHLMADYVRSRLQLSSGQLLNDFDSRSLQASTLPSQHVSAFQYTSNSKDHLFKPIKLPRLSHLAAVDKTTGRLSPVQFRGTTSQTTASSPPAESNRCLLE